MAHNHFDKVIEIIVEKMEQGVIPWKRPFRTHNKPNANWNTKKPYRGINALMTSIMGYKSPYWLTFNQIRDINGAKLVNAKGKGVPIIFAKTVKKIDDSGNEKVFPVWKRSTIFNIELVEGIECPVMKANENMELLDFNPIDECEDMLARMHDLPQIRTIQNARAYYQPMTDHIGISEKHIFTSVEEYYATLFHEIIHSTGHDSRLKRKFGRTMGSELYAKEELIAEIGASFLCDLGGILPSVVENSTAYIQGWLSEIKKDPMLIINASSQAQKAINYLNVIKDETDDNGVREAC